MIYFDNAATTFPKPPAVVQAVREALVRYGANPGRSGHDLSMQTAQKIYECREKLAKLFCCQSEQIVFTKNCTESVNIAIKGMLHPGDHLIISDLEHNAVYRVAEALRRAGLITYDVAAVTASDEQTVLNFERLIRPNTRMIACTHASNVFGFRLPVEKIGAMAHRRGLLMVVDAAQTAGLLTIDLSRMHIDYLCMPGHKGLYGPAGTGVLIVNNSLLPQSLCQGGTGSLSMEPEMPDFLPDRLESGTINTSGIIGLGAGVDFVLKNTPERLYRHEMQLCSALYNGLRSIRGVVLYSNPPQLGRNLPVVAMNYAGLNPERAAELLNQHHIAVRAGFHCAALAHRKMGTDREGTVRMSLGAFNSMDEVRTVCKVSERIARIRR